MNIQELKEGILSKVIATRQVDLFDGQISFELQMINTKVDCLASIIKYQNDTQSSAIPLLMGYLGKGSVILLTVSGLKKPLREK